MKPAFIAVNNTPYPLLCRASSGHKPLRLDPKDQRPLHFPRGSPIPYIALTIPKMRLDERGEPKPILDEDEVMDNYDFVASPHVVNTHQFLRTDDLESSVELDPSYSSNYKWYSSSYAKLTLLGHRECLWRSFRKASK